MKTFTFAILTTLLTLSSALPTALENRREGTEVIICTGEHSTGECESIKVEFSVCTQLQPPFWRNMGSFSVAPGAFCRIT
jgi:hypothetical protein